MQPSRREFFKRSAAAGALVSIPFRWAQAKTSTPKSGDKRTVAAIGVGGTRGAFSQGRAAANRAAQFGRMIAVCDVDAVHNAEFNSKYDNKLKMYTDYRELLEREKPDIVVIGTPDHWHVPISITALKAGCHVYCEKPLTLTIEEGFRIRKAVKESGRVFQVGTQQRSENDNRFLKAIAIVKSGRLGKNLKAHCAIGGSPVGGPFPTTPPPEGLNWDMWQGPANAADYSLERRKEFRWYFDYSGGKMTDWGAHHIDISQWAMGMDNMGPLTIEGTAEHPVPYKDGWPTVSNKYNAATKFHIVANFPKDMVLHVLSDGENGITIEGTKATIFVSRSDLRDVEGTVVADMMKDNPLPEGTITKLYKGKKPGNHMANFFECCKDRTQPISDVATHHRTMTTAHLANIAIRLGRKLTWDAAKEQIVGDDEANKWQKREQRKGYEIVA
jgi:myo-inositol 2-dehydrogenase / D-chiro-inositol 1-dehydrogenase